MLLLSGGAASLLGFSAGKPIWVLVSQERGQAHLPDPEITLVNL